MGRIELLDCTLRDGAYIVESNFGTPAIRGITRYMQDAGVDIVECGWLKNNEHKPGTTFYHVPSDLEQYLIDRRPDTTYVVMIDWDRYDLSYLPECDHKSIDAIRVVFPRGRHSEAIEIGEEIRNRGYRLFFQAANTLGYSPEELVELAKAMNEISPEALSVVDTFGAMYSEDLERIVGILDEQLDKDIKLGFHSHNNQQLSFALSMRFVELLGDTDRDIVVDSSLCGMGRGAGNTTTELLVSYLNRKRGGKYDLNMVLDAIDIFMEYFLKNYSWGYSTPYFLSGMYCAHVNNIAYLLDNHRANAKDMNNIFCSMPTDKRLVYDYDLLEQKYLEYIDRKIDDSGVRKDLRAAIGDRPVLMLCSGRTVRTEIDSIQEYINRHDPVVIGINALFPEYRYDYCFFSNKVRYAYAAVSGDALFDSTSKIVTSNIKTSADDGEQIINVISVIKPGRKYFDNAGILCLRLLASLGVREVSLAGFDGFNNDFSLNYADERMPSVNSDSDWDVVNEDIRVMLEDLRASDPDMHISFITQSLFK